MTQDIYLNINRLPRFTAATRLCAASLSSEAAAAPRGAKYSERGGADRQRAFTEPKYSSCQLSGKKSAACALLIGFRWPERRARTASQPAESAPSA